MKEVLKSDGFTNHDELLKGGIYVLLRHRQVVYVGKAKTMLARIAAHRSLSSGRAPSWLPIRGVKFDEIWVRPCHPDRIDALEQEMICKYLPRFNTQHKPKPGEPFTLMINGMALPIGAITQPEEPLRRRSL